MRGKRLLLWAVLALPAALMTYDLLSGRVLAMDLLHPSGELSVRLMVAAMLPGPLAEFFGLNRFFRAWLAVRRNLGVAAFLYGLLHLAIYVADMRMLSAIVDELTLPAIWTGWLALALMSVPAAISFNAAMRALKRRWKQVQMFVYPAFTLALVHWLLLDWAWQPAIIHLAPLIAAWLLRLIARSRKTPIERSAV
ncbi:ferric reductase-like transmembrane domain-containing protein [Croceicoccus sp. Ery15]|uniref:ferric reductase-like transmembrane domain-containing protein n=1 Tax=Croceicoccus sp. Ery15 TaxID=1703338 RepID=UPI001E612905|nr:ferric reductase-like transmembrane domain-containing protein [Croceicoccus sp. Ery15]